MKSAAAALALLGTLAGGMPALAEMRAVVIGVDDYASKQHLEGSVADARDIAGVLKRDGVTDLSVLIDHDATRAAFDRAWSSIVDRAAAGDVLLLAFSGHGIRVPEAAGHHETPDGYDKGFLLQPYDEKAAPDEILRDENLYDLFAAATAKGVQIVFVADACHSGAAVRGLDPRGSGAPFRFQRFQTQAAPVVEASTAPPVARPANPAVTVFSATDPRLSIQEVLVDGTYRGALSYAVARGLEGPAATNAGVVTAESLRQFVSPLVRVLSGNRQIPQFTLPKPDLGLVAAEQATSNGFGDLPHIPLAVVGDLPADVTLSGVVRVADSATAEITWDGEHQQVVDATGDVLASGVGAGALQGAIDARRVLDGLRAAIAHQGGGDIATTASAVGGGGTDAFFTHGMQVRFDMHPTDFPYLTIADLNASGTVQFMYPLPEKGDPETLTADTPLSFDAPVTPPYGADFIVTIASRQPPADLLKALRAANDKVAALDLYNALKAARARDDIRVGIEGVYSCQSLRNNGQCDSMLASSP